MKKTFYQLVLFLCLLLSLQACGSRGGGSDSTNTPADNPPGSGTTPTIPVASIQLSASPAAINPLETSTITVILLNSTGQPVAAAKAIDFSLSAPELGTINPSVTTSSGSATQTFTAKNIEGIVKITASVDGKSASQDIQISKLVAASTVNVSANPDSITNGGTSVVSAAVFDGENNPMPNGTTVNFNVDNSALGTIVSAATTTDGIAKATFSAGTAATGTVTVSATSGVATGTTAIEVTGTTAGSIEFVSATPQIISIKGSGGLETSEIKFLVRDSSGFPIVSSQSVRLELSGPNGGEYLGDTPGTTIRTVGTVNGEVSTILHSGTIPGTATINASVLDGDNQPAGLSTSSGVIAIGGGIPSAGHFSLSADVLNIEGLGVDNVTNNILTLLADRYGNNKVLEGTTVSFYSECGAITPAVALDAIGQGSVVFRTQQPDPQDVDTGECGPMCDAENAFMAQFENLLGVDIANDPLGNNPRDGICSITAVVDGEEKFIDANASGAYEDGESFVDTYDDIHIDKDDDPMDVLPAAVTDGFPHDPGFEDLVVDRSINGTKNGTFDGLNGLWDNNKRIAKRINLLYTGEPGLTISTGSIDVPNGGSQTIYFALHDLHYNRPVGGTSISVSWDGAGTMTGTDSFTYLDSSALGTPILAITITDDDPDTDERSPGTLEFSWNWLGNEAVFSIAGSTN